MSLRPAAPSKPDAAPDKAATTIRDPEDRRISPDDQRAVREKMFDKTLADSYPASDPPSTLPNPSVDSIAMLDVNPVAADEAA
jgi:hypothetical protein